MTQNIIIAVDWYNFSNVLWIIVLCKFFSKCHYYAMKETPMAWWRHQKENFPRYWPSVWGIPRSPVNSPHKGQWQEALMLSLIYPWINGWVNNREAGDLRCHGTHYDVIVMEYSSGFKSHINSLRPSDTYMVQKVRPSLAQTMACHLISTRPFSELMLDFC